MSEDIPKYIKDKATSLQIETKKEWDMKKLLQSILTHFEERYMTYIENGFPNVKDKWESYGYKIGKPIWIKTLNERWQAIFLGIAEDGGLLTQTNEGEVKKIYSAEIDWFEEE